MMATDIEDVDIDGVRARKFTYISNELGGEITIIRYIYFMGSYMYRIDFYSTTNSLKNVESDFEKIIDSYTIKVPADSSSIDALECQRNI